MRISTAALLISLLIVADRARATSCATAPPCTRVKEGSIFFTGVVLTADVVNPANAAAQAHARVRVEEVFSGSLKPEQEVDVVSSGWIAKGVTYLFDVRRNDDGSLAPTTCGVSGKIDSKNLVDDLDFLRKRKLGKTPTSLSIYVSAQYHAISDVSVSVASANKTLKATTDAKGYAHFEGIEAGHYRIQASRRYYSLDSESSQSDEVNVLPGTCSSGDIALQAQGVVTGLVRSSKGEPIPQLTVELMTPREEGSGSDKYFSTSTSEFRFDTVLPGRYLLGTNLLRFSRTSPVPRTFYPGTPLQGSAIPIDLELGHPVENLVLQMPDFGAPREIRITVVDDKGKPVPNAEVRDYSGDDPQIAGLFARNVTTDLNGRTVAHGFEGVRYQISATLRGEGGFAQVRFSHPVDIAPGKGALNVLLVLNRSFGIH